MKKKKRLNWLNRMVASVMNIIRPRKRRLNWFTYWRAGVMWKYAVKKAEKAHAESETKERFFVMPFKNKLIVMNRSQFRKLKNGHYMFEGTVVKDLIKECFYFTADRGENYFATEGKNDDKMGKHEREARINAIKETKRRMWLEYRFS